MERWSVGAPLRPAVQGTQSVDDGFENACRYPRARLLRDRRPGRTVDRRQVSWQPSADDEEQVIQNPVQVVGALSVMRTERGTTEAHSSSLTSVK